MLYTIAQAAKAMAVEQSIILKAIEDGHIIATKDVSGEWHVEDHSHECEGADPLLPDLRCAAVDGL